MLDHESLVVAMCRLPEENRNLDTVGRCPIAIFAAFTLFLEQ